MMDRKAPSKGSQEAPAQMMAPNQGNVSMAPPQLDLQAGPAQLKDNEKAGAKSEAADVVLVAYTGGVTGDAQAMDPQDGAGTTEQIAYDVLNYAGLSGLNAFSKVFSAGATAGPAVDAGYNYIMGRRGPNTKVLVYGYSRGGDAAVRLCDRLNEDDVPVEMLITVDAAYGYLGPALVDRSIPPNVERNINQYQEAESRIGSRGDSNTADNPESTLVVNSNLSNSIDGVDHGNIDEAAQSVNTGLLLQEAGVPVDWSKRGYPSDMTRATGARGSSQNSSDSSVGDSTSSGGSYRDRDSSSSQ